MSKPSTGLVWEALVEFLNLTGVGKEYFQIDMNKLAQRVKGTTYTYYIVQLRRMGYLKKRTVLKEIPENIGFRELWQKWQDNNGKKFIFDGKDVTDQCKFGTNFIQIPSSLIKDIHTIKIECNAKTII